MNITRKQIQFIRSLKDKKARAESKFFVAEGNKIVADLLPCLPCKMLLATAEFMRSSNDCSKAEQIIELSQSEIDRISFMRNPQQVLAVFSQPESTFTRHEIEQSLSFAIDNVQDPGNMGTILRIADWFGIENVFCSPSCADCFNPKTVQATMGAIARVKVHYMPLPEFLQSFSYIPVYGAFLDGTDIYKHKLSPTGIITLGSEGAGISQPVEEYIKTRLYIPSFPAARKGSESLNVSAAAAIICSEFRRRVKSC